MAFALVGGLLMLGFQLAAAFNLAFFDLPGHVQSLHVLGIVLLAAAVWMLCLPALQRSRWRSWHTISPEDQVARAERVYRAALLAMLAGVHLGAHSAIRLITGNGPFAAFVVLASLLGSVRWLNRTTAPALTSPPLEDDTESRIRRLEEDLGWHHQHAADHGCPWGHAAPSH